MNLMYLIPDKLAKFFLNNIFVILSVLLASLLFVRGFIILDPDFGWRVKTGEHIIRNGIPRKDPFTYSMGSFPYVDHAWTQSVFISMGNTPSGKAIIGFFYTLIALATLVVVSGSAGKKIKTKNNSLYKKLLGLDLNVFGSLSFLLTAYILSLFFGIRAQVASWLMLAVLVNFLTKPKVWNKIKVFTPFFFFLWANLHGSFFLGLAVYFIIICARSAKSKKIYTEDFLILIASAFATLVNPYKTGIWREVISSVTDVKLKWTIVEWMPALTMLNLPFAILVALSLVLVIKQIKIFSVEEVVLYFVFLLAALSTRRHLPLWSIIACPMLEKALYSFFGQISKIKGAAVRLKKVYKIAWIVTVLVIAVHTILDFKEVAILREGVFYPKDAVTYLKRNLPSGEIFSEYGWGGYLIWKLPEKKVFIDGRMPSWRWDKENDSETGAAIDDYNKLIRGELNYKEVFNKYAVDTVLWSKPKSKSPLDKFFENVERLVLGKDDEDFVLTSRLENDGWQSVFDDDASVVYSIQRR